MPGYLPFTQCTNVVKITSHVCVNCSIWSTTQQTSHMIMQTVSQCLLFWWYHSVDKHQAEFHTKSFLVLLSSTMFDARWSTSYWQTKWSVFFFQNPVCGKDICKKLFNKNQILLSTTCTCQTRKPNLINYSFEDYLCTLSSSNVYNTSLYTCNKLYLSCPSEVDVGKKMPDRVGG